MWYTPFCIRCFEVLKPVLLEVAETLSEKQNTKIAVIDGSDEKELKEKYKIERFFVFDS